MNRYLLPAFLLLPLTLLHAAPGVETIFQRVALSGQPAPGFTNNVRFSNFKYVSLADDGRIAFTADISGPGVTSSNNLGLWAGLPGEVLLLVRTGDPAPGEANAAVFENLWGPNLDNHQTVGFLAQSSALAQKISDAYTAAIGPGITGRPTRRLPHEMDYLFGAGYVPLLCHVVNAAALRVELSGPGVGPTNDLAIIAGPPTNVVIVAQKGSPAPGTSGSFTFFPADSQTLALMPDGNVAFRATASDPPATLDGLWFGKAGNLQMVAGKGPAPDSLLGPGYTFGFGPSSQNVEVNARGELAFGTLLSGPGLSDTNSDFVVAGKPGNFRVIAQMGQPAPGVPGAFFGPFAPFSHVLLGADGTVAFVSRYSDTGWDFGLWLAPTNGTAPVLLMRNGQQAPGAPAGVVFTNSFQFLPPFEEAFMNSRNQIVFRARAGGPGVASSYGIWLAEPNGALNLLLRKGDSVDVGGGVIKQVDNVTFGVDPETIACPEDGRRSPFNDRGEVALVVYFTDFSSGLFLARTGIILSGEKAANDFRIRFPTLLGKTYRVDFTTNVPAASWNTLQSSVNGTGAEVTVTDTNAAALPRRFYRTVRLD